MVLQGWVRTYASPLDGQIDRSGGYNEDATTSSTSKEQLEARHIEKRPSSPLGASLSVPVVRALDEGGAEANIQVRGKR